MMEQKRVECTLLIPKGEFIVTAEIQEKMKNNIMRVNPPLSAQDFFTSLTSLVLLCPVLGRDIKNWFSELH